MLLESDVREELYEVLQGDQPIEDFASWLSVARMDATPDAEELAASISLLLYEYFDGYMSEAQLREHLTKLVAHVRIVLRMEWESVAPGALASAYATSSAVLAAEPQTL